MPRKKGATRGGGPRKETGSSKSSARKDGRGRHEVGSLRDGFLTELADMMSAEHQLLKALPKLAQAAQNPRLRDAFEMHEEQTQAHVNRLERAFRLLDHQAKEEKCEGIAGIIAEGEKMMQKAAPGPVRDAVMIAGAQKVEHYEIASYGTLCAWAEEMGEDEVGWLLEANLREERMTDRNLSRIAETMSNEQARMREGRAPGNWRDRDEDRGHEHRSGRQGMTASRGPNGWRGGEEPHPRGWSESRSMEGRDRYARSRGDEE
jgi:ferritin-like metal-binding protein YciE